MVQRKINSPGGTKTTVCCTILIYNDNLPSIKRKLHSFLYKILSIKTRWLTHSSNKTIDNEMESHQWFVFVHCSHLWWLCRFVVNILGQDDILVKNFFVLLVIVFFLFFINKNWIDNLATKWKRYLLYPYLNSWKVLLSVRQQLSHIILSLNRINLCS